MKKVLLLACAGTLVSSPVETDVCSDIVRLKNEAKSNFSNIRGDFVEEFDGAKYYDTLLKLAGASACELDYDAEGPSYSCKWIGQDVAAYEGVVSQVAACLSGSRIRTSTSEKYLRTSFSSNGAYISVVYRRARNQISIRVMP